MVDIPDKDLLAPGHRGCAGCGASIAVKLALNALGENTVAISATGCLEVMTTPYPESSWDYKRRIELPANYCGCQLRGRGRRWRGQRWAR